MRYHPGMNPRDKKTAAGVWIETGGAIKIIPRASNCFLAKLDER